MRNIKITVNLDVDDIEKFAEMRINLSAFLRVAMRQFLAKCEGEAVKADAGIAALQKRCRCEHEM